jgi:hypothetical protein
MGIEWVFLVMGWGRIFFGLLVVFEIGWRVEGGN